MSRPSATVLASVPVVDFNAPPEMFNFSKDIVDKWAQFSNLKAMIWTNTTDTSRIDLSFKHFSDSSHRVARWMSDQLGIRKGDRIIIMLPRLPEWWEIILGAIRLGAVFIPCTTLLTPKDLDYRLSVSHARVYISDEAGMEKFFRLNNVASIRTKVFVPSGKTSPRLDGWHSYHHGLETTTKLGDRFQAETTAKDPCLIYFTSGTSGLPKMVLHNHLYPLGTSIPTPLWSTAWLTLAHLGHVVTGQHWHRLSPGKILWNTAELGWAKVAWSTFGSWSMGATLFIQDDRGVFSAERLIQNLYRFEITTLCAPATAFRQLVLKERLELLDKYKPKALECCATGGEALNPYVLNSWKAAIGLDIYEGYGQTETLLLCGNVGNSPVRPGSMGKPMPHMPLSLVDDTGKELPPGIEGNIALRISPRMPWMFDGYLKDDNSTSVPETVDLTTGQRWYMTGDRAKRDKDGYFWFVGRADDVISTAGYRVGPFEIESSLKEHEGVVESGVVASPDSARGEIVKAFIVLTDEYRNRDPVHLAKNIQDFVARTTAPYKKPREIEFVNSLPKTISGKVRHVELRARERLKKAKLIEKMAKL